MLACRALAICGRKEAPCRALLGPAVPVTLETLVAECSVDHCAVVAPW